MSQGVYTSASSYLLPVEQLLQLGVQQLWSKKVQKYPDTLHPTPEVAHTSKGQLKHHQLNGGDGILHSFCSLSLAWQTETPLPHSVGRYGFDIKDAARKRALCIGSDESVNSVSAIEDTLIVSHVF
eukprot:Em0010g787a